MRLLDTSVLKSQVHSCSHFVDACSHLFDLVLSPRLDVQHPDKIVIKVVHFSFHLQYKSAESSFEARLF